MVVLRTIKFKKTMRMRKRKNNVALVSTSKKFYKPGYRIELISMEDPAGLPPGSLGYVDFVDDAGQIHMKWDSGSSLALIQNVDKFKLIPDSCGTKYVIKGMLENKEVYYKKRKLHPVVGYAGSTRARKREQRVSVFGNRA